jgi:hypothetical protein
MSNSKSAGQELSFTYWMVKGKLSGLSAETVLEEVLVFAAAEETVDKPAG